MKDLFYSLEKKPDSDNIDKSKPEFINNREPNFDGRDKHKLDSDDIDKHKRTFYGNGELSEGKLFYNRRLTPMMMYRTEPFDSEDYIFELKHDGARCLAYIGAEGTDFLSRNFNSFLGIFPELKEISEHISGSVILDGELVVLKEGRADFGEYQKRAHLKDKKRIARAAAENPAQFVAFDILYRNGSQLTELPLMERKGLLNKFLTEGGRLAISRFIEFRGVDFFNIVAAQNLEGIIAKKKNSKYYFNKRTHDWQKIKSTTYSRKVENVFHDK